MAYLNSSGVYTSLSANGVLPDSMEFHELAQTWLVDRSNQETLMSRMSDVSFKQMYVENMISIICELQLLSITRPTVREAFKEHAEQDKKGDVTLSI